jgi:pimeloyl-ACP methyl ester carboxylesterase
MDKPQEKTQPTKSTGQEKEVIVAWTFDGVRLEGDFYPAPEGRGKKTPVLVLLHSVGKNALNASRADFGKLPEKLQKLGYAVATFDFRGYGKSKTIASTFWSYHQARSKTIDRLEARDFTTPRDLLDLVNDCVTIKAWLNKKNNMGDCNSNLLGIIGVDQGAMVGLAWVVNDLTDFNRSKERRTSGGFGGGLGVGGGFGGGAAGGVPPGLPGGQPGQPGMPRLEGEDIACLVAVSMSNRLGDLLPMNLVERWLSLAREKQIAMYSVYGGNDREAVAFWNKATNWVKPPQDKTRFKNSKVQAVKGTNLSGAKLLMNDTLDLNKSLQDYLEEAVKKAGEAKLWTEQVNDNPTPVDVNRLVR